MTAVNLATVYISDILPRADDRFVNSSVSSSFLTAFNRSALAVNNGLAELTKRYPWINGIQHDFHNKNGTVRRDLLGRDGLHLSRKGSKAVATTMQHAVVRSLVTFREEIVSNPEPTVRPTGPLTYSEIVTLIPPALTIRRPAVSIRRLLDAERDNRHATKESHRFHKRHRSPLPRPPVAIRLSTSEAQKKKMKKKKKKMKKKKKQQQKKDRQPPNMFTVLKVEKPRFNLVEPKPKNKKKKIRPRKIRHVSVDEELDAFVLWIEGPDS